MSETLATTEGGVENSFGEGDAAATAGRITVFEALAKPTELVGENRSNASSLAQEYDDQ